MSTAREREAKTIKKDIGGNASLTPAINAQGLSSFSYARPGEVGYDRYAGPDCGSLPPTFPVSSRASPTPT